MTPCFLFFCLHLPLNQNYLIMIYSYSAPTTATLAQSILTEGDRQESIVSVGAIGFYRAKRQGRNPSTGARTSRKYGLATGFDTGLKTMSDFNGNPII